MCVDGGWSGFGDCNGLRARARRNRQKNNARRKRTRRSTFRTQRDSTTQMTFRPICATCCREHEFYYVESANAISVRGSAEDIAEAQKILSDIDRPRKTYRLTYTVSEGESGHAAQHFVVVISQGNKSILKQGSRVPIVTGSYGNGSDTNTQVQYQDVGLNLDASLEGNGDGLRLRTKVEQTSVAEEKSNVGIQDPLLHQAVMEGESAMVMGKPIVLGSME